MEAGQALLQSRRDAGCAVEYDGSRNMFRCVDAPHLASGIWRGLAYYVWNCQTFSGRWARLALLLVLTLPATVARVFSRRLALRILHTCLRGMSQDRLDVLGEEFFTQTLKTRMQPRDAKDSAIRNAVLVTAHLEPVARAMAKALGADRILANRLDLREGLATGRLKDPVLAPPGLFRRLLWRGASDGLDAQAARRLLGLKQTGEQLESAMRPVERVAPGRVRPKVVFNPSPPPSRLSVREALAGKNLLLAGVTGFIGKVWLAHILTELPEIGRVYLLVRRNRSQSALQRFEKIVSESPVFAPLHERYGDRISEFFSSKLEVIEGDICQPNLGLDDQVADRLAADLDLFVNSTGLTDFNPDLRDALAVNLDGTIYVLDFIRRCDHAALMHLSTCFVAGNRDGRVREEMRLNYTPREVSGFDAEQKRLALHERINRVEAISERPDMTETFKAEAAAKSPKNSPLSDKALEKQVYKNRSRWVRQRLIERGVRLSKTLGWPNTYCMTKSLAESQILLRGAGLAIAVVRPAIVESAVQHPFAGWNEGVNTTAPLSHLVSTYFRQLPSRKRKCLDVIPVDLVCRGMTLVAAALVHRCHEPVYQLASSGSNPCDMRRTIELTGLAHRKHYFADPSFRGRFRSRFDTIPVSKARYVTMSVPSQRFLVRNLKWILARTHISKSPLQKTEKGLDKLRKMIELYEPFILHNEQIFEAENVRLLSAALPPEERDAFGYDMEALDWWNYWINIHIPGLRHWVFPLIEGRPLDPRPIYPFKLQTHGDASANGNSPPCPSS